MNSNLKLGLLLGAAVIGAGSCGLAVGGGSTDSSDPTPAPTVTETVTATPETVTATPAPVEAPEPSEEPPAPVEPVAEGIGNGDHLIGTDVQPGTYRFGVEGEGSEFAYCVVEATGPDDLWDMGAAEEGSVIFEVPDVAGAILTVYGCTPGVPA